MKANHFQTIIIGGGITGAGIFRDLCLHQTKTLLIEKGDFCSQTSSRSSKMLHGGIRYLENFDFHLVFEALHEKNFWIKHSPHLCYESPFILPIYQNSSRPLWMIRIGLFLYDLLSGFENSPHQKLSPSDLKKLVPLLGQDHLTGAGVYYDAIMDDARMGIEVIVDGLHQYANSEALNYHELIEFERIHEINHLTIKNLITGEIKHYTSDFVVFATGPFTDQLLSQFEQLKWQKALLPSQGTHIWFSQKDLPLTRPMLLSADNNRVVFVIPQNEKVLVGTTEVTPQSDFFNIQPTEKEIDYLLNILKQYFPECSLDKKQILSTFCGIRPLVAENDTNNRGKTSREHKIFRPFANVYAIAGGKYTTFRVMGQEITREIVLSQGKAFNSLKSKSDFKYRSGLNNFSKQELSDSLIEHILKNERVTSFDDFCRRLSVYSREHFDIRFPQLDFDQFFLSKTNIFEKYFKLNKEDIISF